MQWSLFLLILMGQWSSFSCQMYEYHFVKQIETWKEAQSYCRSHYTDLAILNNMDDMRRLQRVAKSYESAWIGLENLHKETKKWRWSQPSVEFDTKDVNWAKDRPNNCSRNENCVMVNKELKWRDFRCNLKGSSFICYNDKPSDKRFHFIDKKKTWLEAQRYCREKYTDLVSGATQLNDAAKQLSNEIKQSDSKIVIGLFRDSWEWSCRSNSSFRNWPKNNVDAKNEDNCAVTRNNGKWRPTNCAEKHPFFCYKDKLILIKETKTWEEAIDYCREKYEDLVSIPDWFTQILVQNKAKKATTEYVWLGLRYSCVVEFWLWMSNEEMCYNNWAPERMSNCDMSGAMAIQGPNYQWFSLEDEKNLNFICVLK